MTLWAKSDGETLAQHTNACLRVLSTMRAHLKHLHALLPDYFWDDAALALFLHDTGKAASGFQEELRTHKQWNYRHEILSAGLTWHLPITEERRIAITLAVLTHHYGLQRLWDNYRTTVRTGKERWQAKVTEWDANRQALLDELDKVRPCFFMHSEVTQGLIECWQSIGLEDILQTLVQPLKAGELSLSLPKRYYQLLRGVVVACDHLASAGMEGVRQGITETLSKLRETKKVPEKELRPFQERLMEHQGSALLIAPTGSGKTAAALLWAQANQDGGRRLFYVLPYTASINAMQKELRSIYGDEEVGTLHHRALYFAYKEFMERGDEPELAKEKAQNLLSIARKLYKPVKVITPYQVLKAFFGVKGFEALLLEMAGGLFVFDEIHAYEPHIVALIVRMAKELASQWDCRFLFMSATLPMFLRKFLQDAVPDITPIMLFSSDERERWLLDQARHCLYLLDNALPSHLTKIQQTLSEGKRVLVVCNSVQRAQEIFQQLYARAQKPLLLHSRFTHRDRERIEAQIPQADLLIGTQAIEVSLNISFDVMFTEPAPIDALLQRMGRVNRFGECGQPAPVWICTEGSEADDYIYDHERVEVTLKALASFDGQPMSNLEAARLVENVYSSGYSLKEQQRYDNAWRNFDGVIASLPICDESEFSEDYYELVEFVEVVPLRFRDCFLLLREAKRHLDALGYFVPLALPHYHALKSEGRLSKHNYDLFVDAHYDDVLGLLWHEREDVGVAIL